MSSQSKPASVGRETAVSHKGYLETLEENKRSQKRGSTRDQLSKMFLESNVVFIRDKWLKEQEEAIKEGNQTRFLERRQFQEDTYSTPTKQKSNSKDVTQQLSQNKDS